MEMITIAILSLLVGSSSLAAYRLTPKKEVKPMTYTGTSLAIAFVVTSFCYWLMMPLMR